jgi:hypothetical protein
MNPLNCASLEASQRLVEKGIVLETDAMWIPALNSEDIMLIHCSTNLMRIVAAERKGSIPAPSMAEVWRELPELIGETGRKFYLTAQRLGGFTEVGYESAHHDGVKKSFESTNPTDALINLLIWVSDQREEGKP